MAVVKVSTDLASTLDSYLRGPRLECSSYDLLYQTECALAPSVPPEMPWDIN
jgi:hypothetical protein